MNQLAFEEDGCLQPKQGVRVSFRLQATEDRHDQETHKPDTPIQGQSERSSSAHEVVPRPRPAAWLLSSLLSPAWLPDGNTAYVCAQMFVNDALDSDSAHWDIRGGHGKAVVEAVVDFPLSDISSWPQPQRGNRQQSTRRTTDIRRAATTFANPERQSRKQSQWLINPWLHILLRVSRSMKHSTDKPAASSTPHSSLLLDPFPLLTFHIPPELG